MTRGDHRPHHHHQYHGHHHERGAESRPIWRLLRRFISARSDVGEESVNPDSSRLTWVLQAEPPSLAVERQMILRTNFGSFLNDSGRLSKGIILCMVIALILTTFSPVDGIEVTRTLRNGNERVYKTWVRKWWSAVPLAMILCFGVFMALHRVNQQLFFRVTKMFEFHVIFFNIVGGQLLSLWTFLSIFATQAGWWAILLRHAMVFFSIPIAALIASIDSVRLQRRVKVVLTGAIAAHLMWHYCWTLYFQDESWADELDCYGNVSCRDIRSAYRATLVNCSVFLLKACKQYATGRQFAVLRPVWALPKEQQEEPDIMPRGTMSSSVMSSTGMTETFSMDAPGYRRKVGELNGTESPSMGFRSSSLVLTFGVDSPSRRRTPSGPRNVYQDSGRQNSNPLESQPSQLQLQLSSDGSDIHGSVSEVTGTSSALDGPNRRSNPSSPVGQSATDTSSKIIPDQTDGNAGQDDAADEVVIMPVPDSNTETLQHQVEEFAAKHAEQVATIERLEKELAQAKQACAAKDAQIEAYESEISVLRWHSEHKTNRRKVRAMMGLFGGKASAKDRLASSSALSVSGRSVISENSKGEREAEAEDSPHDDDKESAIGHV